MQTIIEARKSKIFGNLKTLKKCATLRKKNTALLRQIILMSSNADSLVMDCFCGSGGFLREAFGLGRRFIGMDSSAEAVRINKEWIAKSACKCAMLRRTIPHTKATHETFAV
ncbi:DNA methyltransferase [Helicobacter sp. 23-1046]